MRCGRCGARTAVQPEPAPRVEPPVPEATSSLGADESWDRLVESWADDRAHEAYLAAMLAGSRLGEAAARYRPLVGDPARGGVAKKRLAAIAMLAEQALAATMERVDPAPTRRKLTLVAALVCALLLGLMFWALAR